MLKSFIKSWIKVETKRQKIQSPNDKLENDYIPEGKLVDLLRNIKTNEKFPVKNGIVG